jgi:hypothetical protein
MNRCTPTDRRIGKWAAIVIVVIAVAYIITGTVWLIPNISSVTIQTLAPSEPYLTIMEILMLLLNPAMVVLFAAIHAYASQDSKTYSLAAFGFLLLLVAITGVVHFINLTVIRRTTSVPIAEVFAFYHSRGGEHSPMFAAEMLGWDFFLGLALLFAAPVFKGDRLHRVIRIGLFISGLLCLIGFSGPASGYMQFQVLAILGYAFGFPLVCLLLAKLFGRSEESRLDVERLYKSQMSM